MSQDTQDVFGAPARHPAPRADDGIERDRWGRYLLPHPETGVKQAWTRVTTMAGTLSDQYNLTLWKMRMVAIGVAMRPDLGMLAGAADPQSADGKSQLQKLCEDAMEVAGANKGRNLGTALHGFTQKLDMGELAPGTFVHPPYDRDIAAYSAKLAEYGLKADPRYVERVVVHPELGVAGTLDRMILCPDGLWRIVDLKTAQEVKYSGLEIAAQLASYATAPYLWNKQAKSYERMPVEQIDTTLGLVIHLPSGQGQCDIYGVDLVSGLRLAYMSKTIRAERVAAKKLLVLIPPPLRTVSPDLSPAHAAGKPDSDELPVDAVTSSGGMPEYGTAAPVTVAIEATQALDTLTLQRIAVAPDRAQLQFIATQCAGSWTPEMNEAAAKRWAELPA